MSNFWDLILLMLSTFVLIAYLLILFQIVVDLFRDGELGVAIDSPALAQEALRIIEAMKTEAYRVRLETPDGALSWVPPSEDDEQATEEEPGLSPLGALQQMLLQPLVPEDLL